MCEGKAASCQYLIEIVNGIEDGNHKTHGGNEADYHLRCNSLGNIDPGSWDLFRNVGDAIWDSHGVCTIQHTQKKHEAIRVPQVRGPVTPHESIAGVARACARARHYRTYNHSDGDTPEDEEQPGIIDSGQSAVGEEYDAATRPGYDQVCHKDMPFLGNIRLVMRCVHLDRQVANDGRDRSASHDPGEEVPPPSEKATGAAISTCRDCGPLIDAAI